MSKINRFAVPALALAAALSVGPVAGLAQTKTTPAPSHGPMTGAWGQGPQGMMGYGDMGPGVMSQGGMGPWMMGSGRFGPAMCAAMAGHMDGRLAYLKAELKITEAQEPLWKAYAAAAHDNANGMSGRCTAMMNSQGRSRPQLA